MIMKRGTPLFRERQCVLRRKTSHDGQAVEYYIAMNTQNSHIGASRFMNRHLVLPLAAVAISCLALLAGCGRFDTSEPRSSSVKGVSVRPVRADPAAREAFELVNMERTMRGMTTLVRRPDLDAVAVDHARDLMRMNQLSHYSSDGRALEHRMAKLNWSVAGENLARNKGYPSPPREAVRGWIASPSHYRNMFRSDFSYTGMAALYDPESGFTYFVQVFTIPA